MMYRARESPFGVKIVVRPIHQARIPIHRISTYTQSDGFQHKCQPNGVQHINAYGSYRQHAIERNIDELDIRYGSTLLNSLSLSNHYSHR